MNTKQIDYAIELSQTLNFSKAAENMYVSQPTFSYQIKLLEDEIGFKIFERSGKGATITPAGIQFISYLSNMREEMKRMIEQGQNFSSKYKEDISISLMVRQALFFLPEAIKIMAKKFPDTQITPYFEYEGGMSSFLKNETDIIFALKEQTKRIPEINVYNLFESHIYLITKKDDPLSQKNIISEEDLYGKTLMVGGGSPPALRALQNRLISSGKIYYFNSPNHDTTLTNIASDKGVCLAPGFLNDHSDLFSWIPYDCKESFSCVLCTHKNDNRNSLNSFIEILLDIYKNTVAFPL